MSVPLMPSAIPTATPRIVRGTRSDRTTMSSSVPVGDQSADDTASIGIGLAPRPRLASTASTSSANRTTISPTRRARMRRGAGGAVATPAITDRRASAGVTRSG